MMDKCKRLTIPESDLSYSFSRSGGPGGQNVNKVNTRVLLKFDLENTSIFTEEQKQIIRSQFPTRVTKEGNFLVVSQKHRSQSANREEALNRLLELLETALVEKKDRKETRVPKRERKKRLNEKRYKSEIKKQRSKPKIFED